jgi:hypothetical protein
VYLAVGSILVDALTNHTLWCLSVIDRSSSSPIYSASMTRLRIHCLSWCHLSRPCGYLWIVLSKPISIRYNFFSWWWMVACILFRRKSLGQFLFHSFRGIDSYSKSFLSGGMSCIPDVSNSKHTQRCIFLCPVRLDCPLHGCLVESRYIPDPRDALTLQLDVWVNDLRILLRSFVGVVYSRLAKETSIGGPLLVVRYD